MVGEGEEGLQVRPGVHLRARLGLMTQEELGEMIGVTTGTLAEWRRLSQGPDFVRTGKTVMYRESDVQDWLKRNVVPVVRT